MNTNYIDRSKDEEIIDIVNSILSNGNFVVETINESVLVRLMELRGTPIKVKDSFRDIGEDFNRWLGQPKQVVHEHILSNSPYWDPKKYICVCGFSTGDRVAFDQHLKEP